MAWGEANRVDFLFGLARNERLQEGDQVRADDCGAGERASGPAGRRGASRTSRWSTLDSWSRRRRVVGKAEVTQGDANLRFVVTSLKPAESGARYLYETVYCARGGWRTASRNASLTCSLIVTSTATMRANQFRLWLASMAYVLLCAVRRIRAGTYAVRTGHLRHHPAQASLKLGALVRVSMRRIKVALASACPYQNEFALAHARLQKRGRSLTRTRLESAQQTDIPTMRSTRSRGSISAKIASHVTPSPTSVYTPACRRCSHRWRYMV